MKEKARAEMVNTSPNDVRGTTNKFVSGETAE